MNEQEFIEMSDVAYYDSDKEAMVYGLSFEAASAYAASEVDKAVAAKNAEIAMLNDVAELRKKSDLQLAAIYAESEVGKIRAEAENKRLREIADHYVGFLEAELKNPENDECKANLEFILERVKKLMDSPTDGGGKETGLLVERACDTCKGHGIVLGSIGHEECPECNGQGEITVVESPAPKVDEIHLTSSQQFQIQAVRDAYLWIRKNNQSIPDDTLDLMKNAAIEPISTASQPKGEGEGK